MGLPAIDNEFMKFWPQLSVIQKESLLMIAKNYIELKEAGRISIEQYNQEIDEAMKRMDTGDFYTHEEVVAMSKEWTNGK